MGGVEKADDKIVAVGDPQGEGGREDIVDVLRAEDLFEKEDECFIPQMEHHALVEVFEKKEFESRDEAFKMAAAAFVRAMAIMKQHVRGESIGVRVGSTVQ